MKIIKIFNLLILIILISGCYNYKEINDYAIVSAISIDKSKKENTKYTVGVQIMNAKKDEESDSSSIAFYKSDGNTIYECMQKILLDLPKELYLGHNEVVILSDKLIKKESPLNFLDYFTRDSQIEKDSLVIISKEENAYDILKIITPLETIPSRNLKETIKVADDIKGTLSAITLDEFIASLSNNGEDPILPTVKIEGRVDKGKQTKNISQSDPNAKIALSTLGYFENSKLKGFLTNEEEEGYKILSNTGNGTYINVKCDDKNYATIKIKSSKTKEKISFKNNKPFVKLDNSINARLIEYNCKIDFLKNNKKIKKLEKDASIKTKKLINKAIKKLYKKNHSDVLMYGEKFNGRKNRILKKLNIKEKNVKKLVKFNLKTKVKIERIGLTIKSIKEVSNNE